MLSDSSIRYQASFIEGDRGVWGGIITVFKYLEMWHL